MKSQPPSPWIGCEVFHNSLHGIKSLGPLPVPSALASLPRRRLHGCVATHLGTPLHTISSPPRAISSARCVSLLRARPLMVYYSPTPSHCGQWSLHSYCSHGTSILPTADTFYLHNVLVVPTLVRSLLSVHQFTHDSNCSMEFDAFGFSFKDPWTGRVILRCNSHGDLYTISPASPSIAASCSLVVSSTLWHKRLGHPGTSAIANLQNMSVITCNKATPCQLGTCACLLLAQFPLHQKLLL